MINEKFFNGMQKLAFNLRDASKVSRVFKARQIPQKNLHKDMIGEFVGYNKDVKGFAAATGQDVNQIMNTQKVIGVSPGKVRAPKKGDALRFFRGTASKMNGVDLGPKVEFTGRQRRMLDGVTKGHEVDETIVKNKAEFMPLGHLSPDVILREHNKIVTMPEEFEPVRRFLRKVRNTLGEAPVAEAHMNNASGPKGFTYGRGQRLSRHARKRMTDILERKNNEMIAAQAAE
jgi:hypothetical protein